MALGQDATALVNIPRQSALVLSISGIGVDQFAGRGKGHNPNISQLVVGCNPYSLDPKPCKLVALRRSYGMQKLSQRASDLGTSFHY